MKKIALLKTVNREKIFTPREFISTNLLTSIVDGDCLTVRQEPRNKHDYKAVAVYWFDVKIGYIYRGALQDLANKSLREGLPVELIFHGFDDLAVNACAFVDFYFYKPAGLLQRSVLLKSEQDPHAIKDAKRRYQDYLFFENSLGLAPKTLDKKKLSYHYVDVVLSVSEDLINKALDTQRGDPLDIALNPHNVAGEYDIDNVSVVWQGAILGDLPNNRLRMMVKEWLEAGLPVYCAISKSAGKSILVELGFYGRPKQDALNN